MAASYGFSECASIECPREPNERGSFSILKSQMHMDKQGHYWCDQCKDRCDLINWAHEHRYPAVRVQGQMIYAIAAGREDWHSSIVMATQVMIDALRETLIEKKRAQLPLNEVNEGAERVKKWLEAFDKAAAELPID